MSHGPLMKCGHSAQGVDRDGNPVCVICAGLDKRAYEIAEIPDLSGRRARCHYYGKPIKKGMYNAAHCLFGGCKDGICNCEEDSDPSLPFFVYKGLNSRHANEHCKHCWYTIKAHWPVWKIKIEVVRRWYKIPETTNINEYDEHCVDKDYALAVAEGRMQFFLGHQKEDTKVFSAKIVSIDGPFPSGRDHEFESHGPFEYDEFYCGCHGWD